MQPGSKKAGYQRPGRHAVADRHRTADAELRGDVCPRWDQLSVAVAHRGCLARLWSPSDPTSFTILSSMPRETKDRGRR